MSKQKDEAYYNALDKRTKEYKVWKKAFEAEQERSLDGIGDVVEKITKVTGIKKVVEFIAGDDCGCEERKEELNKKFPFSKIKCLDESEYNFLKRFMVTKKLRVTFDERNRLYEIHNRVFGTKLKSSSCPSCVKNIISKLDSILKTYK